MVCLDDRRRYFGADGDRPRRNRSGCLHKGSGNETEVAISAGTVAEALIVGARRNVGEE